MTRQSGTAGAGDRLFALLQHVLPQHLLSRMVHWLTRRRGGPLTRIAIRAFIKVAGVDMSEAAEPDAAAYPTFNAFFVRRLKEGARPPGITDGGLISPVDGCVSQIGALEAGLLLQAKGRRYALAELLGDESLAAEFRHGAFATLYLAPYDYHRIHMPAAGRLRDMRHEPGRLFSVNAATVRAVPNLFVRNERVSCVFDGENGPFAMVLVGAMFVGSIETVWAGEVTPGSGRRQGRAATSAVVELGAGEEMGRFNMGSTVILVHARDTLHWRPDLSPGVRVRMGELLAPAQPAREAQ